jgi:hypothetical protein
MRSKACLPSYASCFASLHLRLAKQLCLHFLLRFAFGDKKQAMASVAKKKPGKTKAINA